MSVTALEHQRMRLTSSYPVTGSFDELVGVNGNVGAHWVPVLAGLEALSHEERLDRIERINRRVRETGIAHDLFADPSNNQLPWRLDLMPLVLPASEWARIETAVIQRARLLEGMLTDIYGPQTLMQQGLIPPRLIFSDPSYLRACQGIGPDGSRLQFLAVDLARSPDGEWRVVDTHTETPAGIGYALANRTIHTHVCGDIFSASNAMRLAPYFQRLQERLAQRINRPDPTIALLTPGPHHNDFFSHAYLARYLGALLVEGDDLRIENDRIYLKTLDGLRPIDLVLRCVAAGLADALELDPSGFLGPVGLLQAVRQQPNCLVNALGTAIAENRGLGGFLPQICRTLLSEDLLFQDVAKHWLGEPDAKRHVLNNLDRYFIRTASERTARPGRAEIPRDPTKLSLAERDELVAKIEMDGDRLVAEEKMPLGTAPSYTQGGLAPRPYAVRVFASAVNGGFIVMPGGLAMTVDPGASMALTAPDGASRDVWVLSDTPQPAFKSLWLPVIEEAQIQRGPRELPSRAADNLFWLGRYVEHADWTFRLLRNCLARIEEDSGPRQSLQLSRRILERELERNGKKTVERFAALGDGPAIAQLARTLMTSADLGYGLQQTLANIHRVASLTRDRLSLEAWRALNMFYADGRWQRSAMPATIGQSLDLIDAGLATIASFNGLSHENMTRNYGWSFLDIGRRLSRTYNMSRMMLSAFEVETAEGDGYANMLFALELADSFITYRSRYRLDPVLSLVLDLLIVDETNPRSLAFQLSAISTHIDSLPQTGKGRGRTEVQLQALALLSEVRLADVTQLSETDTDGRRHELTAKLSSIVARVPSLSNAITRRYFSVIEKEPQWVRVRSRQSP